MKKAENNYATSMEFTNALNKYIPSLVLQQWINKIDQQNISLPELQPTETVVLFADISGFTMISEACALMGVRGNEELAFCINRYMEGMVKSLGKYGGDIIKFVGDAMIVMWPRFSTDGQSTSPRMDKSSGGSKQVVYKDQLDDRVTIVRKAIQCAIDIQNELNNKKIMSNVTNLSVKIGIGFGQCALLYVGGVFNRSEFFTVGDALTQALKSEENATAGGQIIVSSNAWKIVEDFFKSEEIVSEHGGKFYKISGLVQGIRTRADAVLLRNLIQADNFARIQNKLRSCIPAAIMPYLEIGYEQYGSETRRLTVMFASLGVDLSSAQTEAGMKKIQKIVTTVQQQVYRQEGSLNKLVMDDKGSTLICIWGLCPFSHEDDAARAILTAINMRRELAKIDNTWCNVGISTGEVFSGVVGTSGSRKEFSVLGDYVNLAARIMYWPKKYKQTGKIHVDLQTKKEADNFIKFIYKGHQEFKGKSISLPIFEPVDPEEESSQCLKKIATMDVFLKIHSNPFIIDRGSEFKKKHCKQIGREKLLHKVCDELFDYFEDERSSARPYFLAIMGEIGSGKTLFGRCIFDQLKRRKDFLRDDHMGSDFKPILTTSLNAESQMKFLNIWRPILQTMMFIHCKKNNQQAEKVIKRLLKSARDEKYDIILDIFNMTELKGKNFKLPIADDPISFVKREKYSEDTVDVILDFLIEFIIEVLGNRDDYYSDIDQSQISDAARSQISQPRAQNFQLNPMVLIFDTVHLMDEASWKLLELVKDECSDVAVILLMQTDTNNQPKIHQEARTFYQETFGNHLELFRIIDLPPFKIEELNQMILELAPKYQNSMSEEINLMTLIDDPEHSIKNPDTCKLKEKEMKKKFLVNEQFSFVNEEVLQITLQRCEGNPMICLNFIFSLLSNDFLTIKDQTLQPSSLFKKCKQRADWSTVPVPGITQKINTTLIDSFIKDMRSKMNKTDSENAVKGILLLKSAAVIGEVFSSRVLQSISPLRNDTHKSILTVLKILEQKDFIEILDETDQKNAICRFRKCFLRETIYQIMLYRAQKKGLHQLMVQYIQNNPNTYDNDPEQEAEKLLNHILLAEDLDSEDKVPFKAKQGLIVKKIANKLMKHPNANVKMGWLTKQGDKPNKKVEKRLMVIKPKELSWYHNEKEFKAGQPLGVIYMSSIYHCVPANTAKSTDDLNIGTCAWRKKEIEKEGKREFIFGAKDEQERDEWISCIEYLRAKAIYDNFTQKFCNIAFPIRRPSEDNQTDQREYILNNLNEFGVKFKTGSSRHMKMLSSSDDQPRPQNNSLRMMPRNTSKNIGSFAAYNLQNINESTYQVSYNNPKDIAQKLKKLYNASILTFVNQVSQNSNKQSTSKYETLKKVPDVLKNTSIVLFQDESQDNIHSQSMINQQNTISNITKPSLLMNQSAILNQSQSALQNDESLTHQLQSLNQNINIKDLRRISGIPRKDTVDDNFDVKSYLDEMKSAGITSPKKKDQQVKITEENEEDDEEDGDDYSKSPPQQSSLESSSLPRKSAISDLTAKSGSPNTGTTGLVAQNYYTSNSDISKGANQTSKRVDMKKQQKIVENQKLSILQTKTLQSQSNNLQAAADAANFKKSRMSKQLDLVSQKQKQRLMTFSKNEQSEESDNSHPHDHPSIFALNVNPTQVGKTPKKSLARFDSIQETEELVAEMRRRERKSTVKHKRNDKPYKEESSSSNDESSHRQEESVLEDDEEDQDASNKHLNESNRDTGKFSQVDNYNSKNRSKRDNHANKPSLHINMSIQESSQSKDRSSNPSGNSYPNQSVSSKELKELVLKQNTKDYQGNLRQSPLKDQSSPTKQTSQIVAQQRQGDHNLSTTNIQEIIAKTIQDQVSQSLSVMMKQVQKLTESQFQSMSNQSKLTPSPPYGRLNNFSKRDSSNSKSLSSSILEDDLKTQFYLRNQVHGGAASSKKISIEKPMSKEQSTRPSLAKQAVFQSQRGKVQREETEVDDEDDYIHDPDIDQQIRSQDQDRMRRQSISKSSRNQLLKQEYSDNGIRQAKSISELRQGYSNQEQNREAYNEQQRINPSSYYSQTNLQQQYSPLAQRGRSEQDLMRSNNLTPNNMMRQHFFNNNMNGNPNHNYQSPMHPQMAYHQAYQNPYNPYQSHYQAQQQEMYYQRQLMDQELFNMDYNEQNQTLDYIPTTYTNTNNQLLISDMNQILNGDTMDLKNQNQLAIVLEDTQCQLKGELMSLLEGDKVEVLKLNNEVGLAECRFHNQTGLFQLSKLKLIKRANHQNQDSRSPMNRREASSQNIGAMIQQKSRQTPIDVSPIRGTEDDITKIFNTRQNFFKSNLNQYADIRQHKSSNNLNEAQQTSSHHSSLNKGNLKMNERRQQRQQKQKMDSAERFIHQLHM